MDIEIILDAAEIEAPDLLILARWFFEAEERHLAVPLNPASILARREEGEPELDIVGAGRRPA